MHVTADREEEEEEKEEEDITSFFTKIITFQNSLTNFYFFRLKLLVAVFQDMLRVIQNFLYFSSSVPENGLWWLDKRLVVSLCLLLFFLTLPCLLILEFFNIHLFITHCPYV